MSLHAWRSIGSLLAITFAVSGSIPPACVGADALRMIEIFPYVSQHVHGSTIAELPNGDLLAAWFQGSGERWADDVAIMGARLEAGAERWSAPFVLADTPEFPDINPILFTDLQGRLWLMWYTVIANQWETSLLKYRICNVPGKSTGAPRWDWQDVVHVKPGDRTERGIQPNDRFVKSVERQIAALGKTIADGANGAVDAALTTGKWKLWSARLMAKARGEDMMARGILVDEQGGRTQKQLGYPYFRRMGWQTKNKAIFTQTGRMVVPLYSDGFSFSLMALTDDGGKTWHFSEPLVGPGNIQPSIALKADGTLVAYMRDNGPPPRRLHLSQSTDNSVIWSAVQDSALPNPGAGADVVTLANGHWVMAYNDTEEGRHSLAISLSTDEGRTWSHTRHLERDMRGAQATRSHYPSIIQGHDGTLHVIYSYHHNDRGSAPHKTIKYASFSEDWITAGAP